MKLKAWIISEKKWADEISCKKISNDDQIIIAKLNNIAITYSNEEIILVPSTGKKDIKGKDIFLGDIVDLEPNEPIHDDWYPHVIFYNKYEGYFYICDVDREGDEFSGDDFDDLSESKIIDNIFENNERFKIRIDDEGNEFIDDYEFNIKEWQDMR